jgi:hypothetical protein
VGGGGGGGGGAKLWKSFKNLVPFRYIPSAIPTPSFLSGTKEVLKCRLCRELN